MAPEVVAKGDLAKGRLVFNKMCAQCHILFGEGKKIGPDLTGSNRNDLHYVLENIIDPSAVIGKDYQNSWCHMDNAIATCAYPPNAKNPVTGQDYPPDQWWNRYAFTSLHPGGVQFAMTDGSVRFINDSISAKL